MPDKRFLALALFGLTSGGCGDRFAEARTEVVALKHIIQLQTAETGFYPRTGRFGRLDELGVKGTRQQAGPVSSEGVGGYRFEITAHFGPDPRYAIRARPVTYGRGGYRSFYADQTGSIYQTWRDEPATSESESVR